ncbi:hypothetical protein EVAR_75156_1 [Eumeta japonica]|uniref:115 kDa protein in type-1 retrotransposable element R1DM n=1 Tax=Eumeta variegata TaxID=151549 RepID=A0A4C1U0J4_EUMVA|nr:hypothetical protein EVAR_75156_1 [Eumeta japonica]
MVNTEAFSRSRCAAFICKMASSPKADDVVLAFSSESSSTIENAANEAMKIVTKWGSENKLHFAPQKTQATVLMKKLKFKNPTIQDHIYTAVIKPFMMYAWITWAPATELEMIRSALNSLQRGFAIKICRVYRTVSFTSAMILAGLLSLDLRAWEAEALYKAKKG